MMAKAVQKQCTTFVLGEIHEHEVTEAYENRMNIVQMGHWRSEQLGLFAVMQDLKEKFGL